MDKEPLGRYGNIGVGALVVICIMFNCVRPAFKIAGQAFGIVIMESTRS